MMSRTGLLSLLYPLLLSALLLNCQCQEKRKLYIVYMGGGRTPQQDASVAAKHHSMLRKVLGSTLSTKDSLVYSYWRSFDGFAAKLTKEEAATISEMEGVVSVNPNRIHQLHTTRSWDFMNLTLDLLPGPPNGSDVIIGFLDSGVWPEHPSFIDDGFGPPPSKWNGTCTTTNFTCNNKIIGARYYNSEETYYDGDIPSPRDTNGHGTHTASTASGAKVEEASYFGLAKGVARGIIDSRIAVYKVCWATGCGSADILKAFDDAISDGVDIISLSLGKNFPVDYFNDIVSIGSFHAMRKGILTSTSAGNNGPDLVTITSLAPWTLTVAATTIDRKFVARMELGNGQVFVGIAVNAFHLNETSYPLIWGGDAANYTSGSNSNSARYCMPGAMNADLVSGKIVYCENIRDGSGILSAGAVGNIMSDVLSVNPDSAFSWPLPSTLISSEDGKRVMEYIQSTENPVATIFASDEWKDPIAPIVASFSSRGPSAISPDILKPDITAPGVNILAGWSPLSSPSFYDGDTRSTLFNIISGTSMSCPHASGAAAYVKAAHLDWSPAAIKSALMTTAHVMDPSKHEDLEFSYGSGQINPISARDPGLVFNASEDDYVDFLCKQGYNTTTLRLVTGDEKTCTNTSLGRGWDLNYPSFSLYVGDGEKIEGRFPREVTNVGEANSTYRASSNMPASISVTVEPSVLTFEKVGERKGFVVTVSGPAISQHPVISGGVTWTDGAHVVRSPVVVYNYIPGSPYNLYSEKSSSVAKMRPSLLGRIRKDVKVFHRVQDNK